MRRLLAVLLLVTVACGDDSASAPESSLTTVPQTTTPANVVETTTAPTPEAGAKPSVVISRVGFASGTIELTNVGTESVELGGLILCQPSAYNGVEAHTLAPGASVEVSADLVGGVSPVSGEVGLYVDSDFGNADSIVAYVEWGETGHTRSTPAVEAGIWATGDVVESTDATTALIGDGTLGAAGWSSE